MPPSLLLNTLKRKPSPQLHGADLKLDQPRTEKINKKQDTLSQHSSSNRLQKGAGTGC
ncbi:hypothetical protein HMI54_006542 [Coelomomyces lativittatus]|nr:hypothetical protein HMI56_002291 [Coelomomyces lativittatus]KAJ1504525.1 hypothetical protein HMI55_001971 [Coelomomyces lativittatus]KAJ1504848.1 hypothetical protein HMI54_006542 [Coelomomyces lativittatus]